MPQAVNISGTTTRRPGVFATVDVSALSGFTLDLNRVAVIGSFPSLQQATPKELSNASALAAIDASDENLARVAKLLYRPSNDDRVLGGPSATVLVSINESSQAQYSLQNANLAQVSLKSSVYGPTGNRTTGTYTASTNTLTLARDGVTETFSDLEDTGYIELYYNGSKANKSDLTFGPETGLKVEQAFRIDTSVDDGDGNANTITLEGSGLNGLAFDGAITFKIIENNIATNAAAEEAAVAQSMSQDVTIAITGTLKSTGAQTTETKAIASGAKTVTSSAFSAVTKILISYFDADTTDASAVNASKDWHVKNDAFNMTPASHPKLQSIFDEINNGKATSQYVITASNPRLSTILTNTIDYGGAAANIIAVGNKKIVSRNVQRIIDVVGASSSLVTISRATISEGTGVGVSKPSDQTFSLAGGAKDAAEQQSDWDAALTALEAQNVQIIVAITDAANDTITDNSSGVASALRDHCKKMASTGKSERCFWYGAPASVATVDSSVSLANNINTRHGAIVTQRVQLLDHLNQKVTLDACYLALMMAGIQAGTGTAVPMTHKRVDILDTVHTWDATDSAEKLITNGIAIVTQDRLGFRVERSVTTYVTDDNPVFSEVSANESLNTCIRDLRNFVTTKIGDQNVNGTAQLVRTICQTRLRQQVLDGIIKNFDADALQVVDLGDRLRVDARIAVIEPLNFIIINAEVVRTPSV